MATKQLTLFKLRSGNEGSAFISCDKQLFQVVTMNAEGNDTTAIVPDWTQTSNQPTITLTLGKGCTATDLKWYYNGSEIVFPSSTFQKSSDGLQLKIVNNLASKDNLFTDNIKVTGELLDSEGQDSGKIEKSVDIPIYKASSNGWMVYINGGKTLSFSVNSTTLTAGIMNGGTKVDTFTNYVWYAANDLETQLGTGKTLNVTRSMVNGYQTFICKAFEGGTELDAESITIFDESDDIVIRYSVSNSDSTSLDNVEDSYHVPANASSCTVTPHVIVNGTEKTEKASSAAYLWKLTKVHANTQKKIGVISGNDDATTDVESEDSYNTTTSGTITVYDKDYVSIVGSTKLKVEVGIDTECNV
jgi:hypothetical protein